MIFAQVKRQDTSYNRGRTPRPGPPPLNRMGSFGRKPYFRPWSGPTGRRQGPVIGDYGYSGPRQNSGQRRPAGRGRPSGQPGDFYGSYDDAGQNAYPDYFQPYEYDDMRMSWPSDRQLPYDDGGASSDEASDFSDRSGHPRFSSPATTASVVSGDWLPAFLFTLRVWLKTLKALS